MFREVNNHNSVRRCGGCASLLVGGPLSGEGDLWVPNIGAVGLCKICIELIRKRLPLLELALRRLEAEKHYYTTIDEEHAKKHKQQLRLKHRPTKSKAWS